jgi:hypothetical protein
MCTHAVRFRFGAFACASILIVEGAVFLAVRMVRAIRIDVETAANKAAMKK